MTTEYMYVRCLFSFLSFASSLFKCQRQTSTSPFTIKMHVLQQRSSLPSNDGPNIQGPQPVHEQRSIKSLGGHNIRFLSVWAVRRPDGSSLNLIKKITQNIICCPPPPPPLAQKVLVLVPPIFKIGGAIPYISLAVLRQCLSWDFFFRTTIRKIFMVWNLAGIKIICVQVIQTSGNSDMFST